MALLVALPSLPMSASDEILACKLTCQGLQQLSSSFRCVSDKMIFFPQRLEKRTPDPNLQRLFFFLFCMENLVGSQMTGSNFTPCAMLTKTRPAQSVAFTAFRCSLCAADWLPGRLWVQGNQFVLLSPSVGPGF